MSFRNHKGKGRYLFILLFTQSYVCLFSCVNQLLCFFFIPILLKGNCLRLNGLMKDRLASSLRAYERQVLKIYREPQRLYLNGS